MKPNLIAPLAALAVVGAGGTAGAASLPPQTQGKRPAPAVSPCGRLQTGPLAIEHVIWIWMENKRYRDVIGSPAAPYENRLARSCGLATNYRGLTHPSLPNYLAATSGSTQGVVDDGPPSSYPLAVESLFSQAPSWRSYQESMPSRCYRGDTRLYAVKHNPAAYYTNLECERYDVPLGTVRAGALAADLRRDTLAAFSFVTPNLCNDTHDCPVSRGDAWMRTWVPKILASPAYRTGRTALFIVWDEDDFSGSNHIPAIVVSPYTRRGARSATRFDHYSLLRTTEDLLRLPPLGHAAEARTMLADLFSARRGTS
jgi:phosphatidylinositol-3-phosphatase